MKTGFLSKRSIRHNNIPKNSLTIAAEPRRVIISLVTVLEAINLSKNKKFPLVEAKKMKIQSKKDETNAENMGFLKWMEKKKGKS